jgi:hypothetical protein
MINKEEEYEMVNHPTHYNKYDVEVVEMIKRIWGTHAAAMWCRITAFKYRMRLGEKPSNPIEQDIAKENVYLYLANKYDEELRSEKIDINKLPKSEIEYLKQVSEQCSEWLTK